MYRRVLASLIATVILAPSFFIGAFAAAPAEADPFVPSTAPPLNPAVRSITLTEAMQRNWVKAFVSGSGIPNSDAVKIRLSKTEFTPPAAQLPLFLLAPGTTLRSTNPVEQNAVVARVRGVLSEANTVMNEAGMSFHGQNEVVYLVEAYGTEFGKGMPTPRTALEILDVNPRWACLFEAAAEDMLPDHARQAAVWLIGGRATRDALQPIYGFSAEEWQRIGSAMQRCTTTSTVSRDAAPRESVPAMQPASAPPASPREVFDRIIDDPFGEDRRKASVKSLLDKWKALQSAGRPSGSIAVQTNTDFALSVPALTRSSVKARLGFPDYESVHVVPGYRLTPDGHIASDDLSVNFLWYGEVGIGCIVSQPDDVAVAIGYRPKPVKGDPTAKPVTNPMPAI